jgi:putative ABC transport system permease protein
MPDWRREIQPYLERLNLDPSREAEIVEELEQHLNDKYDELISSGVSPEVAIRKTLEDLNTGTLTARLQAVLKPTQASITLGEPQKENIFVEFWQDIRFGARVLRMNGTFTIIAVLSLALGIGANTAIFQLLNAVRMRTLPVENPQELGSILILKSPHGKTGAFVRTNPQLTYKMWENIQNQQQGFSSVGAWYSQRLNLSQGGEAKYAQAIFVSGGFFDTLGVRPALGRLISAADDHKGCGNSGAVLSDSFWHRQYGGNSSALGKSLRLEGRPFEVIGVAPSDFFGVEVGRNFDVAIPLCSEPLIHTENPFTTLEVGWWLGALGRLKPGWTIEKASAQMQAISKGIFERTVPSTYDAIDKKNYQAFVLEVIPAATGVSQLRRQYETPLWLLLAISTAVLLIACANLANLMVARASARTREMAVRMALGASRSRLVRQLLAESFMLALLGSVCGAGLAQILSRVMVSFLSTQRTQVFLDLGLDWRVLIFTAGLAILTCVIFGLMPAIQASRTEPGEVMKTNARGNTATRSGLNVRGLLVVSQVSLSLVLMVGAFLFVRTFRNLTSLDAGFRQSGILTVQVDMTPVRVPVEQRISYKKDYLERIRAIPGVESAANVAIVPLSGSGWNESISIPELNVVRQVANFNQVSSDYFRTVGTQLLAGRDFNSSDSSSTPPVAIVTETFAKKFLNGKNPLGESFKVMQEAGKPDRIYQIVGYVKDTKYITLREEFTPIVFVAETQDQHPDLEPQIVLRSRLPLENVIAAMKSAAAEMNPSINLTFKVFERMIREGLIRERLMATLSGFFGFLAAILAMIGLYGVISYMVARRQNEIGIRMALGANKRTILSMILSEAAMLLAAGLAIGTFISLLVSRTAKALLFGLEPWDPLTIAFAVICLGIVATAASLLPAHRAATLNPTQALREE